MAGLLLHPLLLGEEVGDDHLGQTDQNTGSEAAQEHLTGGDAADTGDDHHGDGGRDDDADGGGHTGDGDGQLLGVALADHLRHEHAGDAGGVGHGRAGDAGKDHGREHVHVSQATVDVTHDGVAEVHEALGNTAFGHGVASEGVEGDSQKSPAVHALKHPLGHGDDVAAVQEQDAAHGGQAQGDANGYADDHHDDETDEQPSDHSSFPPSSFAVRVTSRWMTAQMMHSTPATGKIM